MNREGKKVKELRQTGRNQNMVLNLLRYHRREREIYRQKRKKVKMREKHFSKNWILFGFLSCCSRLLYSACLRASCSSVSLYTKHNLSTGGVEHRKANLDPSAKKEFVNFPGKHMEQVHHISSYLSPFPEKTIICVNKKKFFEGFNFPAFWFPKKASFQQKPRGFRAFQNISHNGSFLL